MLNKKLKPLFGTLKRTYQNFKDAHAAQAAASIAYYTFFSLFPLLLLLISITGAILKSEEAYQKALTFIQQALPISQSLIKSNVQRVLELRGTVGAIGLLSLLWSSLSAFSILAHNINRAWPEAETRDFLGQRRVALGMIGGIFGLFAVSLSITTAVTLLPRLEIPLDGGISLYQTPLWKVGTQLVAGLFTLGMFLLLYRWVPNTNVTWKAAITGAVAATFAWEIAKAAIAWYLSSGLARYELVYGSLGAVVALLLWIYLSGALILFGAHLSATVDNHPHPEPTIKQPLIILNPVAGTSDPDAVQQAIQRHAHKAGWDPTIYETTGEDQLEQVIQQAIQDGCELCVAAGGDGTVSAVASSLVNTGVPLGILPTGSGNVLAHELKIPMELEAALQLLTGEHREQDIDAFQVDERYFFLNLSMGISALTMRDTKRREKRVLGWLAYLWTGLKKLTGFQPARFSLNVDGTPYDIHASEVIIANSGSLGASQVRIAPHIRLDDGTVDICIIRARNLWDYTKIAWDLLWGRPKQTANIRFLKSKQSVKLTANRMLPVQADGDPIGRQAVEAHVAPRAVRVIVPENDTSPF